MSLASCDSEDAKPISKVASYPSSLYGAWAWPCIEDYDTEGTNFPLYRQQKRSYGENSTYAFERTVYQDSSCTGEPVAKGVHKGTYNIVNVIESHPTNPVPYVEVDYEITEIIFEGNKPLAATTASRNRHVVGFQFYGIAKVLPEVGQLHIGWVGEMENDVLLRPTQFDEILHKSRILQPTYSTV